MKKDAVIALNYGAISLFTTILHNIFLLYHVDLFVSVYTIDKTSFWIGECIFLVWNSLNDPLFGWIGDKQQLRFADSSQTYSGNVEFVTDSADSTRRRHHPDGSSEKRNPGDVRQNTGFLGASTDLIRSRINTIAVCGPLLALCLIAITYDWHLPIVQFTICLCLYDSFLTAIDLQHSALLAELSLSSDQRTSMNTFQSAFSALGSLSVFLSYAVWDKTDLTNFRIYCLVLAFVAAVGFVWSTSRLHHYFTQIGRASACVSQTCSKITSKTATENQSVGPVDFILQLYRHKNFLVFSAISFVQVFHCHFNSNFFPLFLEALVDDNNHFGTFLIGISFVLPHINNIFFLELCRRYGTYTVIKGLFYCKLVLALMMWTSGCSYHWLLYCFIACNRIFTEGTCKLMSLIMSDLVDEDYVINQRAEPISALLFGLSNFLSKPGQTLAPVVGTFLISFITGYDVFTNRDSSDIDNQKGFRSVAYRDALFSVLVYVPIVCAVLQIGAWSFFRLHGASLKQIRWLRSKVLSSDFIV